MAKNVTFPRIKQMFGSLVQQSFSSRCSSSSASSSIAFQETPSVCPFSGASSGSSPSQQLKTSSMTDASHISSLESSCPMASSVRLESYDSIPSPKGLPLIGTLLDLIRAGGAQSLHEYCDKRHSQLGSIYREKLGSLEVLFISDAKMIQKVYQFEGKYPQHLVPEPWIIYNQINGVQRGLFFMDGPEWGDRRRILNKLLLKPTTISEYAQVFNEVTNDLLDGWNKSLSPNGQTEVSQLERELYNWSIESLGTMIFGRRLGCVSRHAGCVDETPLSHIHDFVHWVQQIFVESANMQLIQPRLAYKLNLPVWKRFVTAADNALRLAQNYVQENMEEIKDSGDKDNHLAGKGIIRQMLLEEKIEQEEVVRIITDLFIAAADTTSHATQWALYLLAKNPECQEKLLNQVNEVTQGRPVEEKDLPQLSYVKGVIKEALRLYPVAPFLSRILPHDLELGGYRIPSGKLISISLFTSGRKSQYFESPESFKPERWMRDSSTGQHSVINSFACVPFGLGVRSCIGRRVAEVQMQILLSRIVQQFRLSPKSEKDIGIKLRMITTPEEPIHLVLNKRV